MTNKSLKISQFTYLTPPKNPSKPMFLDAKTPKHTFCRLLLLDDRFRKARAAKPAIFPQQFVSSTCSPTAWPHGCTRPARLQRFRHVTRCIEFIRIHCLDLIVLFQVFAGLPLHLVSSAAWKVGSKLFMAAPEAPNVSTLPAPSPAFGEDRCLNRSSSMVPSRLNDHES